MVSLFHQTSFECSKLITKAYSTSFSMGIRTLDERFHEPIYAIYGFVRCADEIVDTFHEYDKHALLEQFRNDTYRAIEDGISLNPVLNAFSLTVRTYHIDIDLVEAFLHSMEMDLTFRPYDAPLYREYIYGSAEVVGLMCLQVFCEGDQALYQRLREPARRLGAAFQKVNFLRDLRSDYEERGRVYFPGVDFIRFSATAKARIESEISEDFREAYQGILELPRGARHGVYLAYLYYLNLFRKIQRCSADRIKAARIRVHDSRKLMIWLISHVEHSFNWL